MAIETFRPELQYWKGKKILHVEEMEKLKEWMKQNQAFRNQLKADLNKETVARFVGWQNWGRHHVEVRHFCWDTLAGFPKHPCLDLTQLA